MRFYLNIYHTQTRGRYAIYYYYILHGYYAFGMKASVGKGTFYMIQQNVNLANPSVVCGNLSDLTPNTITLYLRLCIMLTAKYMAVQYDHNEM